MITIHETIIELYYFVPFFILIKHYHSIILKQIIFIPSTYYLIIKLIQLFTTFIFKTLKQIKVVKQTRLSSEHAGT